MARPVGCCHDERMRRWDLVAGGLLLVAVAAAVLQFATVRATGDASSLLFTLAAAPSLGVGFVIARREPRNIVGPVLMLVGLLPVLVVTLDGWAASRWPGASVATVLSGGDWIFMYLGPIALALVFPDGHLLSRRWRVVAVACVAVPVAFFVSALFAPASDLVGLVGVLLLPVQLAVLVASAVSVVLRYRRGGDELRRQVRWLAVSAILAPAALVTCWIGFLVFGEETAIGFVLLGLFIALAASVGIALLRHQLYGFDRLLAGTVRWALLIATLGLLFSVLIVTLGVLLGGGSPLAAALTTLACAAAFLPVHRALRRWVDTRFQPQRQTALAAVRSLVAGVRSRSVAPEELLSTLRAATGDTRLRIEGVTIVPGPHTALTPADLRDIEHEARLPLELAQLRGDLRDALQQTAASRARLVQAADDERGRIQRDLHDGAQQNLVALGIRLRSMQRSAGGAPEGIDEAVDLVQRTIRELRALAQGVRPSALDDGLAQALRAMVRSVPLPVDLQLEPITVEEPAATAAYYTAAEAVTNALKHAGASRIGISLERSAAGSRLRVTDDGRGGVVEGSGLAGLRDRIEAVGGILSVSSSSAGTQIDAVFP